MIRIENLKKSFDEVILFDNFNLEIETGKFVVIMGASGCGKTTLLNMIGALEPFDSGRILIDDIDISNTKTHLEYFRTKVGFLFQNFALVENKTVEENLNMIKPMSRSDIDIDIALESLGLLDAKKKKVYKLSGGEQQRVALARLLIKKCDIILADEPTGSLDAENAKIVLQNLKKLNDLGKTVIVVTHDKSIRSYGDQVIDL